MQLYLLDGARLKELRERAGLSQEELSRMCGQRKGWAQELEQQSRVHLLEILMNKLTGALGVGTRDLTTHPAPPEAPTSPEAQKLDAVKLKVLREEAAMSQDDLEEAAGLEPGSVAQAEEQGEEEGVYASVETIWNLANALEVSPTALLKR